MTDRDDDDPSPTWPVRVTRAGERRSLSRSATRALDVLEYFGQVRRPLRAIEITRRFELHPSTVNQLLKTMVESAHQTFDASTKSYLPSPRLTRFGSWMVDTYGSDERLRLLVDQLHAAAGEVVTLTTPNDYTMQVIDLAGLDFVAAANSGPERGLRISMFGSATGAAHLSSLPRAEVQRLADRARLPEREHKPLLEWLARIRRDGYADGPSVDGGHWSLAAPLPDPVGRTPLVLGLAGPADRIRPRLGELAVLLKSAIARLSA